MVKLTLPYPPSVNTYYRHVGHKVLISATGRQYRKDVGDRVGYYRLSQGISQEQLRHQGRLSVTIRLFPPDRRTRDIDNTTKGLLDSLTHAGLWEDDGQIDRLTVQRLEVVKGGSAEVEIERL